MAGFLVASSGSMMIGAPISAALLSRDWFGVAAWRSMFILEGIPAVLFGFIVLFYMTDRPKDAKWLEAEEREWLISELETEKQAKKAFGHLSAWQVFRHRNVLLLLSTIFFQNLGLMAYVMWLPTMIQRASGSSAALSALLTTVPFGFGALAIYLAGRSSDRTGKRKLHVIVPAVVGAFFLALSAIPGQPFPLLFLWLTVTATAYSAGPSLWVLPTLTLTESAAASAIGLINIFAALGSFVGPSVVGLLLRMGYSYDTVVLILSASFLIQALSVSAVRVHRTVPSEK
jgi:ACS family tartrate transporter-like MFS transporter